LQAVLLGYYKRLRALNGPVRAMSHLIAAGTTVAQGSSPPSPMANFDACASRKPAFDPAREIAIGAESQAVGSI
jgi:hypothetical protein